MEGLDGLRAAGSGIETPILNDLSSARSSPAPTNLPAPTTRVGG